VSIMPIATLRQGIYVGASKEGTDVYHSIPYARPFTKHFEQPLPLPESDEEFPATELANNCPQLPSRFTFLNGNWHPSTKYDEKASAVLSVYAPGNAGSDGSLPVIVWVHGGAWVTASIEALLEAQTKAMIANPGSLSTWGPTTTIVPCFGKPKISAGSKQILIGWTANDGKVFSHLASHETPISQLSNVLTDRIFREPSIALAKQLWEQGHVVTTFELQWAPEDFAFGPTYCTDLPFPFGFEAWPKSLMCLEKDRDEWETREKRWRQRLGDLVRDGTPFVTEEGVEVF
jgi:carboxylesterase type B